MFGKRKKEKVSFGEWLNGILSNFTLDAAAFNFNIYENKKDYSAELVATASFDEDDEDWACDEIYASRNDGNEFCFNAEKGNLRRKINCLASGCLRVRRRRFTFDFRQITTVWENKLTIIWNTRGF